MKQQVKRKPTYDILGNIAIIKFQRNTTKKSKQIYAKKLLKQYKNITTAVEKTSKISGRLRKAKTNYLTGEKTKTAIYKENNCIFKFDIDETYFSPRLSSHRKETCEKIAKQLKNNSNVLVMFAGVAPWAIVLARILKTNYKNKKNIKIISNEINRKANQFAKENIKLNKLQDYIEIVDGDAKKLPQKLKQKFDVILMPRPNLKETFLQTAFFLSKKNTKIFYHGFGTKEKVLHEIREKIKNFKIKTSKIKIQKAGDIAVREFRWLCEFNMK